MNHPASQKRDAVNHIQGESLVLASSIPGKLCFDALVKGSVLMRSTYLSDDTTHVVYQEGKDYTIDYPKGEISRTLHSTIPDYSLHPLFGKVNFDHTETPNYSNDPYFIWVDYTTENAYPLAKPNDQQKYLVNFRKRVESGTKTTIVSYGNSITAGGEASSDSLRFQFRYLEHLQKLFPAANLMMQDVSIPGRASSDGIELWDDYVGKTEPDLVLLGWGMNDHNVGGNSPEQFKNNLVMLVTMIRERKNAEVILFSAFPPNHHWKFGSHRMEHFATATKDAALESQCAYADVYAVWQTALQRKDQSSLLANNINHPNDFGHWLYAEAFKAISL
ncbi:MAG: hypothetical protein HKN87_02335 [Saprospiraceae bacterium]|nr:hypothetical protein [Saprospiraceae bacterium]